MALLNTSHHTRASFSTNSTTVTITATTAGSLLVFAAAWYHGVAAVITSITGGGTWSAGTIRSGDANSHIQCWYAPNVSGGVTSLTVNRTANGDNFTLEGDVLEFSEMPTTSSLDKDIGNSGTSSTPNVATGTLAQANEEIVAMASHTGADTTFTADTGGGYTQISENEDNDNGQTYGSQRKTVATTASDQADWTLGASRTWFAGVWTFPKTAGGAAVLPPRTVLRYQAAHRAATI